MTAVKKANPALAAAAERLAGFGFRVFPVHTMFGQGRCSCGAKGGQCPSPGKHPRTETGVTGASSDLEQVRAWWSRWPDANIGLATGRYGEGKHLVVIDADVKHDGLAHLASLEGKHGKLPASVRAFSGGGGAHVFLTSETPIKNSASRLAPGVDTRGEGGYVLVAPSNHASGGFYTWDVDGELGAAKVDPIPAAWLALCQDLDTQRKKREPLGAADKIISGGRNDYLTSIAGTMRQRGMSEAVILTALLAENLDRCVPPVDEAEVKAIAESVARYAPGEAWKAMPKRAPGPAASTPPANESGEQVGASWQDVLLRDKHGEPTSDLANVVAILAHAPEWEGVFALDDARGEIVLRQPPPFADDHATTWRPIPIDDAAEIAVSVDLRRRWGIRCRPEGVHQAVVLVAQQQRYNPVTDYLGGLAWDGVQRLSTWLVRYAGAKNTAYVRGIGAAWLRAAVARAFVPGCKVDSALVFEGDQGKGKSSLLGVLGGEWFNDDVVDLHSKDTVLQIRRSWINELPEMAAKKKSEVEQIKAFMSRTTDRIRPPYGRNIVEAPRRCVFAGTTNTTDYLQDVTGNRRWWPFEVGAIDLDGMRADRDQLWAEAVASWRAGDGTNLPPELWAVAAGYQKARVEEDAWDAAVRTWLAGKLVNVTDPGDRLLVSVTVADTLTGALAIDRERWDRGLQTRVGNILRRLGWQPRQVRVEGQKDARERRYYPPLPPDEGVTTFDDDEDGTGVVTAPEQAKDAVVTTYTTVTSDSGPQDSIMVGGLEPGAAPQAASSDPLSTNSLGSDCCEGCDKSQITESDSVTTTVTTSPVRAGVVTAEAWRATYWQHRYQVQATAPDADAHAEATRLTTAALGPCPTEATS